MDAMTPMPILYPRSSAPSREQNELDVQQLRHLMSNALQGLMREIGHHPTLRQLPDGARMIDALQQRISLAASVSDSLFGLTRPVGTLKHRLVDLAEAQIALMGRSNQQIDVAVEVSCEISSSLEATLIRVANEALTNAIKHGFRDRPDGQIDIRLVNRADGVIVFTIADNGAGFEKTVSHGQGVAIMQSLINPHQGDVRLRRIGETTITEIVVPVASGQLDPNGEQIDFRHITATADSLYNRLHQHVDQPIDAMR